MFEEELQKADKPEIVSIKMKVKKDKLYQPSEKEVDTIKQWVKNPEVYLDEGQLQKVYGFEQGSIWDFFLHALKIRKIPTPKERIEKGFESYIKTYDFDDKQIRILRDLKDIVSENIVEKRKMTAEDIFNNPVYSRIIGSDYQEVNQVFNNKLPQVFEELQTNFRV